MLIGLDTIAIRGCCDRKKSDKQTERQTAACPLLKPLHLHSYETHTHTTHKQHARTQPLEASILRRKSGRAVDHAAARA